MARITTRPQTDEDDIIDEVDDVDDIEGVAEEEQEENEPQAAPAVSDSRRRRQMKRGDYVEPKAEVASAAPSVVTPRKDRPTPSQRTEVVKPPNVVVKFVVNIREYFKEVRSELSKVTWLSWEETRRLATIVIVVTAISSAFLGLVSFLFGYLIQLVATEGSTLVAGIVTIALILVVAGLWLFREQIFGNRFEL